MKYSIYQIDAFTNTLFKGNPACVIPLNHWLDTSVLMRIAQENAVPETAFFVQTPHEIQLRWFTPDLEMDLCGHATLATAHVLKTHLHHQRPEFSFSTQSGLVKVIVQGERYYLDFPTRKPKLVKLPIELHQALNIMPIQSLKSRDYVLVYKTEAELRSIQIERTYFDQLNLGTGGVIVTALGDNVDFVSRYFTPQASILEDPVTGSAHCSLIPFWAEKLQKESMLARQLSKRGGQLFCEAKGERVLIGGHAVTYSEGVCYIDS